mmetsp:Transcript_30593/g.60136  ORF Transcript_30593/g.60136 Transcript_30593/m.60136 type:complete len:309 (+) Transcript_30593:1387-2313(+)
MVVEHLRPAVHVAEAASGHGHGGGEQVVKHVDHGVDARGVEDQIVQGGARVVLDFGDLLRVARVPLNFHHDLSLEVVADLDGLDRLQPVGELHIYAVPHAGESPHEAQIQRGARLVLVVGLKLPAVVVCQRGGEEWIVLQQQQQLPREVVVPEALVVLWKFIAQAHLLLEVLHGIIERPLFFLPGGVQQLIRNHPAAKQVPANLPKRGGVPVYDAKYLPRQALLQRKVHPLDDFRKRLLQNGHLLRCLGVSTLMAGSKATGWQKALGNQNQVEQGKQHHLHREAIGCAENLFPTRLNRDVPILGARSA